ncbi:DUF4238 domain-containing protein [Mycobacterium paraense]|uniref:DUF4238 domain-containing protein n=1 Tax=Mycobacterium paraense TaxID=767916 RepID=UPI000A153F87
MQQMCSKPVSAGRMKRFGALAQVSRSHHTVPRFYLDGFAKNRKIGTVRLPGDRRFIQSTKSASAQTDFYALPENLDDPDLAEKALAEIEGEGAKALRLITDHGVWPLDQESRAVLAMFLVVQYLRGPDQRRQSGQLMALMAQVQLGFGGRESLAQWADESGISLSQTEADSLWEQIMQPGGPPIALSAAGHIRTIGEMFPEILPYFVGRPWILVRFRRRSLLTCDTPVSLIPDPASPLRGVGVGTAWGISVPLTRKIGLVLSSPEPLVGRVDLRAVHSGVFDQEHDPSSKYAALINTATIRNAREWVFHHPDDDGLVPSVLPAPRRVEVTANVPDFRGETPTSPPSNSQK